jgi:hypothetical protein
MEAGRFTANFPGPSPSTGSIPHLRLDPIFSRDRLRIEAICSLRIAPGLPAIRSRFWPKQIPLPRSGKEEGPRPASQWSLNGTPMTEALTQAPQVSIIGNKSQNSITPGFDLEGGLIFHQCLRFHAPVPNGRVEGIIKTVDEKCFAVRGPPTRSSRLRV